MKRKEIRWKRLFLPAVLLIFGVIHFLFVCSADFSDKYNDTAGALIRYFAGKTAEAIPFSLSEYMFLIIPLILFFFVYSVLRSKKKGSVPKRIVITLITVLTVFYGSFVMTFAAGYYTAPLEERAGLVRVERPTEEELRKAADDLADKLNELSPEIEYGEKGNSLMPYDLRTMKQKIKAALDSFGDYDAAQGIFKNGRMTNVKFIALSEPMTYTHISGVYTFFSGESNVNVNYPDFIIPFTAAHEVSHQLGVAREDEANFTAYLVCVSSDDPYIRYSSYLNMFLYVSNDLFDVDPDGYDDVYSHLNEEVRRDLSYYDSFFVKYKKSGVSEFSHAVNDLYLTSLGTDGVVSYDYVTQLYLGSLSKGLY